ncbi:signal peptidase complex subunit 2-like isoform X1 [Andrographis paniculata]|uniref:signal peptidase complex subunit 2-like isoform X1 n=1 Tax=Andrographis paniculata TaxID=175694 RepID=UPI0021E9448E|nr:signal peptidase complex subunit 2-like isoform X1 [Andrographis paniculata]XP_051121845.1 signal peptidase complex subunit 2-like isoform X1 [Andrographis paniculata]XP_051121847.1 signal peptidase complex subunit 2-like isoform X1 [Andrographis paniculata]
MAAQKNSKKTNLLDSHSVKHALDESVTEIVNSKGYPEDFRTSNVRLLIGIIIIVVALFAQFYNKKFPENRNFLVGCIVLYVLLNGMLQLIVHIKEKNVIMFTYPPPTSFNSTGLVVTSKLPRFSDMYSLIITSADPQSVSAKPPVHFTKSVTKWFTKDGVFSEGIFQNDVVGLLDEYAKESNKLK